MKYEDLIAKGFLPVQKEGAPVRTSVRQQDAPSNGQVLESPSGMSETERRSDVKSEKQVQEQIANWLRQRNVWFCRSRMDRKTSNGLGTPDFLFTWPTCDNHFEPVAVEAKSEAGRLTPEQERVRDQMRECGWTHFTIRSLPELRALLDKF